MEYINVSQFYESILCFSIPLLIIQRIILLFDDLSKRYEDYRLTFYQDQFKFTKQYQYAGEDPEAMPQQVSNKDQMLDKKKPQQKQINEDPNNEISQRSRSRTLSFGKQGQPSIINPAHANELPHKGLQKKITHIQLNLETDKQLHNTIQPQSDPHKQPPLQKQPSSSSSQKQQIISQSQHPIQRPVQPQSQLIQQSQMTQMTHDLQLRRETKLDSQPSQSFPHSQSSKKQVIQIGGNSPQTQHAESQRIRLKYSRRIDDAFNDYIPIIMSMLTLGILTQSVYIYSMCCFFGYAFTALLFNYIHILDRIEGIQASQRGLFGRGNYLLAGGFVIGLSISYWVSDQFY